MPYYAMLIIYLMLSPLYRHYAMIITLPLRHLFSMLHYIDTPLFMPLCLRRLRHFTI